MFDEFRFSPLNFYASVIYIKSLVDHVKSADLNGLSSPDKKFRRVFVSNFQVIVECY